MHLSQNPSNKPINIASVIAYDKCMFFTWQHKYNHIINLSSRFLYRTICTLTFQHKKKRKKKGKCIVVVKRKFKPYPSSEKFHGLYILGSATRRIELINIKYILKNTTLYSKQLYLRKPL